TSSITFRRASSTVSIPVTQDTHFTGARVTSYCLLVDFLQPLRQKRSCRHDRGVALRSRGNHPNFHLQKIGNEPQVVQRRFGQLRVVLQDVGGNVPSRYRLILSCHVLVLFGICRHFLH